MICRACYAVGKACFPQQCVFPYQGTHAVHLLCCHLLLCIHCRASILLTVRVLINHMLACDVNDYLSFLLEDLATAVAVYEVSQKVRALPEVMTFDACSQDYVQMCKSSQVLGCTSGLGLFLHIWAYS